jgi:biopolymer transport protein ExbB
MRYRCSQRRLVEVFCLLAVCIAGSAIFFPTLIGGTSPVLAADPEKPDQPKIPAANAAEKPAAEKTSAEKPAAEKPAADKSSAEKPAGEKAAAEKTTSEKPVAGKPSAGKPATGKPATEKTAAEKAAERAERRRAAAAERMAEDELLAEKREADQARADKESILKWLYRSMGMRYVIVFLIVTFNEIALLAMIFLGIRRNRMCPPELIEEFEAMLDKKQYQEAYELAKKNKSFLGKVLAAGMAQLAEGHAAATEAMQARGEEQTIRLEQRNGYIAMIAQIAPMLGLLATVDGIVRAFGVIASSDVTPKPSQLAQGIGIALVNTVVGLWLAIPSIVIYQYIRNRLTLYIFEAGMISTRLMRRFASVSVVKTT